MRPAPEANGKSRLSANERAAGRPDPHDGLFVASIDVFGPFGGVRGPLVGGEVVSTALCRDWLQTGRVRRWYEFAESPDHSHFDRPARDTLTEHLRIGPRHWIAATSEAATLIGHGFVHALVDASSPVNGTHLIAREAQRVCNVPAIGFVYSLHEQDMSWAPMLSGPTYPFDVIFSPTVCGMKATQRGIQRFSERIGVPLYEGTFEVIPYGVTLPKPRPSARKALRWRKNELVLLSIARFASRHKFDAAPLLLLFRELAKERPARLVLAGSVTEKKYPEKIEAMARALGISDTVELRPDFDLVDKDALLASADVFVAFSDNIQETYGVAVVEAMAAGLPVVASDWDGFKESVVDGETGFLIPTTMLLHDPELYTAIALRQHFLEFPHQPNSTVIDVAAALRALRLLADDPGRRRAMGQAGRRRAAEHFEREHNHARMANRTLEAVREARSMPVMHAPRRVFDWHETFASFPTAWLGDDATVHAGPFAHLAHDKVMLAMIGAKTRPELAGLLAATLAAVPAPLGELSERLSKELPGFTRAGAARHVVHFAKHGLLRLDTSRPQ